MQFKALSVDAEQGIFEGYASVAGVVDGDGDVVEPGAFTRTLAEGFARNGVKLLALHNEYMLPVGKSLELREDEHGLYIKGYISPTSMGSDVRQLIKDGVLSDLSIGYDDQIATVDDKGVRHLKDVELYEISIVTWPANAAAKINGYKGGLPGMAKEDTKQYDPALVAQLIEAVTSLGSLVQQLQAAAPTPPAAPDDDDDILEIGEED
jgi:HK97 family phage prohead protease